MTAITELQVEDVPFLAFVVGLMGMLGVVLMRCMATCVGSTVAVFLSGGDKYALYQGVNVRVNWADMPGTFTQQVSGTIRPCGRQEVHINWKDVPKDLFSPPSQ